MTHIYYYRIRRYHVGDEPYSANHGEIIEEGHKTVGGSYLQECLDVFNKYQNDSPEPGFSYSIEIIDSSVSD